MRGEAPWQGHAGAEAIAPPARHYNSARHRPGGADGVPGSVAGRPGGRRPQFLTAAAVAVAVALVSGTTVYATVHGGMPAERVADSRAVAPAAGELTLPPALTPGSAKRSEAATAAAATAGDVPAAAPAPSIGPELAAQINAVLAANSGYQLGVALIDVGQGGVHEYGVRTKFVAASTAKILAAAGYYRLVETGQASLTARMGASTAAVQIRQMVQQSNNESWALILHAIGPKRLTDYAASLGISYDDTQNLLTPAETARALQLLYTGQLLSPSNTEELLSFMQNTNYETLIPAAVPPGVDIFHKYGLLEGNLHDASILVQGDRAFVFVVYTRGASLSDMPARARVIQELTRTVAASLF
jgi:beta-lactamase class A